MQSKPWKIHILGPATLVQHGQNVPQFADVSRCYSLCASTKIERPQSSMLE